MKRNELSPEQQSHRKEILQTFLAAGWRAHEDMAIFDEGRDVPFVANVESWANGLHFRVFYDAEKDVIHFRAGGVFEDEFQLQIRIDEHLTTLLTTIVRVRDAIRPGDFRLALRDIVRTGAAAYVLLDEERLARLVDDSEESV
jgi:hypothetical protein